MPIVPVPYSYVLLIVPVPYSYVLLIVPIPYSYVLLTHAQTGSPYWLAPEVLLGSNTTAESDVYAFGVLLYEIFTREDPYDGQEFEKVTHVCICMYVCVYVCSFCTREDPYDGRNFEKVRHVCICMYMYAFTCAHMYVLYIGHSFC